MNNTIYERLKEIRSSSGLNQSDFSKSLGIGQSTLAMLEVGKRDILDRHIKTICSVYDVNEEWLRHGTGDMFVESDSSIIAELATEYKLDELDQLIIEHYVKLDEDTRRVLKGELLSIAKKAAISEETAATEDSDIDIQVEQYRQELIAEKKIQTYSASQKPDIG